MSYLVPQLITAAVFFMSLYLMDANGSYGYLTWVIAPTLVTALVVWPAWLVFYCIELVFYK